MNNKDGDADSGLTPQTLIAWRWQQAERLWPGTTEEYKRKWWTLLIGGDIDSTDPSSTPSTPTLNTILDKTNKN